MLIVLISGSTKSVRKAHSATARVPQQKPYKVMAVARSKKLPVVAIMMKLRTSRAYDPYMRGFLPILSLRVPAGSLESVFVKPRIVNSRAIVESV